MSHAFFSYRREDWPLIEVFYNKCKSQGIRVWLDKDKIDPGNRWKMEVRKAIQEGVFFLAFFSRQSLEREVSYQNTELVIAIEELQRRPAERSWFIPIRLDECNVPERSIGGGETLADLQWTDFFPESDDAEDRIISLLKKN